MDVIGEVAKKTGENLKKLRMDIENELHRKNVETDKTIDLPDYARPRGENSKIAAEFR